MHSLLYIEVTNLRVPTQYCVFNYESRYTRSDYVISKINLVCDQVIRICPFIITYLMRRSCRIFSQKWEVIHCNFARNLKWTGHANLDAAFLFVSKQKIFLLLITTWYVTSIYQICVTWLKNWRYSNIFYSNIALMANNCIWNNKCRT